MPRNVLFVFAAVLSLLQPAFAADSHLPQRPLPKAVERALTRGPAYYVDSSRGDDANDGSIKKPWRTIQHAVGRLQPGDTLYLREGIYHETVYLTKSGTADAPIVIAANRRCSRTAKGFTNRAGRRTTSSPIRSSSSWPLIQAGHPTCG